VQFKKIKSDKKRKINYENFVKIKTFRNFAFPKSSQKLKVFGNLEYDKKRNIFIATEGTERCSDN